jgi:hypothetical protein
MKLFVLIFCLAMFSTSQAQHTLTKIWESDTTLAIPESVLPDPKKAVLYVSLIDGGPWEMDGKGSIGKLGMNGKIINPDLMPQKVWASLATGCMLQMLNK